MKHRLFFLSGALLLLAGCNTPPATPEQRAADQCRMYRGYLSTQERHYVVESCERQMGQEACRECLK